MDAYLPVIWAVLIGTGVALYVVLDGFDLGIGILFPFAQSNRDRDHMIGSIAPLASRTAAKFSASKSVSLRSPRSAP